MSVYEVELGDLSVPYMTTKPRHEDAQVPAHRPTREHAQSPPHHTVQFVYTTDATDTTRKAKLTDTKTYNATNDKSDE